MQVLKDLELKINRFVNSDDDTVELTKDESLIIFSFSEEYERLMMTQPKHGIGGIITGYGIKDIYFGGRSEGKKAVHFLNMFNKLPLATEIYMSLARISFDMSFERSDILNRIFVDLKKIDVYKRNEENLVLVKAE